MPCVAHGALIRAHPDLTLVVSQLPNLAGLAQVALATYRVLLSVILPFLLMLAATTCLYRYLPYRSPA